MAKERKEFRDDRFTWKAGDFSDISHPDPEVEKKIKKNIEEFKEKEQQNKDQKETLSQITNKIATLYIVCVG